MTCSNCMGRGYTPWIDDKLILEWVYCEQCNNKLKRPKPSPIDCTCHTCYGRGWNCKKTGSNTECSVCTECNNKCNQDKPDETYCACENCGSRGYYYEENNGYLTPIECPHCKNRCHQDKPVRIPSQTGTKKRLKKITG